MSLEVYFRNNLIDEEYYTELTNSYELFNDSFKLGTTPSNTYKLSIAKEGVTNQPSNVILKENNTTFAELEIDNIQEEDYTYSYDLTDKMLNLEFYYDASEIFVNGKTTLLAIAQDICSKAGLTLGTTNFRGYNKEISWYDNRRTAREYIGFIAELNGGFARVENSTLYFRKQKTSSVKTIDIDDCENFIIGEYHKITRVVYELGTLKYEFGDDTGNTLYLNSDNVFITEESEVQAIYNDIKDFEFYSFETGNCPIDYNVKAGDIITFTDGTNNYPTIAQYELEYFGTWIGGYSLSVNTERQEETKIVGNTEKIKNLQIIVDRDANTITQLVETTEEIEHQFETLQDIDGFAEGKYIYLDDASDELITSAKFNGETSQETRSGKNILGLTNGTYTNRGITAVVTNGIITLSGTSNDSSYASIIDIPLINPISSSVGTVIKSLNPTGTYTGVQTLLRASNADTSVGLWSNNAANQSGTLSGNAYYLRIQINYNVTVNCTLKAQVESGTTATDFEQYGVMPSPDYPSEIENVKGRNKINVQDYSGTLTGYFVVQVTSLKLEEGKTYTFSLDVTSSVGSFNVSVGCGTGAYQRDIKTIQNQQNGRKIITFTPTATDLSYGKDFCFRAPRYTSSQSGVTYSVSNIQLEEGSKATSYVPYNSLEVKVGNKNLLDYSMINTPNLQDNGYYKIAFPGNKQILNNRFKENTQYTLSFEGYRTAVSSGNAGGFNFVYTDGTSTNVRIDTTNPTKKLITSTPNKTISYIFITWGSTNETYIKDLILEEGSTATDYEEHQEQAVYFPLAEGQKLYEGSYLADDGIHNVRGQVVFDGSNDEDWTVYTGSDAFSYTYVVRILGSAVGFQKSLCSHFKNVNYTWVNTIGKVGQYCDHPSGVNKYFNTDKSTLALWKAWLQSNPITVEYELPEEEIIPYNTEQQAAWNNIKSLHTYKTVTHIYSDAYAEIGYIKDNMLSDFETKASAQLTKNDVAQLKIENGRISSEVSSTQSQFNNYYTKNEADNNTNSTKAELQNIIQQNKTEIEQTTQEIALRITDIETNGVDKIETSMGYTFNNEGMNIDKEGAATASTIDNEAFKVKNKSANENVFFAGYVSDQDSAYRGQTIVESTNLVVKNYLNIEGASRFQPYVNPVLGGHGTGAFDIG